MAQKYGSRGADLFIIAILLLAGLRFTQGLEKAFDVLLYDESFYLYWGVNLENAGLPGAGLAPLYAVWYFIVSLFAPDRVDLYYLNYKLMTLLLPILMYTLLRVNTVSIPVSLTVSWLLLISRANVQTWPKVSHFALALILASLVFIAGRRTLLRTSAFAAVGSLLVSYVRPEYFIVYVLSSLLFIGAYLAEPEKFQRYNLASLVAYGFFSALLLWTFGLPLAGNRSMVAFGQHFSLNWVSWTGSPLNPWTNWKEIVSQNFGSVQSIPAAIAKNPAAFMNHVAWNLREAVTRAPLLFFPTALPLGKLPAVAAVAAMIAGLHIVYRRNVRTNLARDKRWLLFVGLFLVPTATSVAIIYPRDHYLLTLGVLTVALMSFYLTDHTIEPGHLKPLHIFLLGVLAIALTPSLSNQEIARRPILSTIRCIQALHIDKPVNVLEAEGGYNMYLGSNFERVAEYEKNTGFGKFLAGRNINMIVVSENLLNDSRFKADPEWQGFLADQQRFGYLQRDIPNTDRKLILKNDLLNR